MQGLLTLPTDCFHSVIQFLDYVEDGGDSIVHVLADRFDRKRARTVMRRAINVSVVTKRNSRGILITAHFANGVLHRTDGPAYSTVLKTENKQGESRYLSTALFVVAGVPGKFIRRVCCQSVVLYEVADVEFPWGSPVCTESNVVQCRHNLSTTQVCDKKLGSVMTRRFIAPAPGSLIPLSGWQTVWGEGHDDGAITYIEFKHLVYSTACSMWGCTWRFGGVDFDVSGVVERPRSDTYAHFADILDKYGGIRAISNRIHSSVRGDEVYLQDVVQALLDY